GIRRRYYGARLRRRHAWSGRTDHGKYARAPRPQACRRAGRLKGSALLVTATPPPAPARAWWRRLLSVAAMDLRPLRRHRDFRLLFIGKTISFFGGMMTYVALPYQTYRLSGSTLAVGLLGLTELVPLLLFAFLGGALADAVDRKWMVRLTELLTALATLSLLVNALLPHPALWAVYALAAVMSG